MKLLIVFALIAAATALPPQGPMFVNTLPLIIPAEITAAIRSQMPKEVMTPEAIAAALAEFDATLEPVKVVENSEVIDTPIESVKVVDSPIFDDAVAQDAIDRVKVADMPLESEADVEAPSKVVVVESAVENEVADVEAPSRVVVVESAVENEVADVEAPSRVVVVESAVENEVAPIAEVAADESEDIKVLKPVVVEAPINSEVKVQAPIVIDQSKPAPDHHIGFLGKQFENPMWR